MNREILFPTPVYMKMVKDPQTLNKYFIPSLKPGVKKINAKLKLTLAVVGIAPPI